MSTSFSVMLYDNNKDMQWSTNTKQRCFFLHITQRFFTAEEANEHVQWGIISSIIYILHVVFYLCAFSPCQYLFAALLMFLFLVYNK